MACDRGVECVTGAGRRVGCAWWVEDVYKMVWIGRASREAVNESLRVVVGATWHSGCREIDICQVCGGTGRCGFNSKLW